MHWGLLVEDSSVTVVPWIKFRGGKTKLTCAEWVKEGGAGTGVSEGAARCWRCAWGGAGAWVCHPTETAIDTYYWDAVIDLPYAA